MAEYIERDKLIAALKEWQAQLIENYGENDEYVRCLESVFVGIENTPAADVRPVVTCERCVYHVDCGYHYCNKWCVNCPDDADFFCAYGEEES